MKKMLTYIYVYLILPVLVLGGLFGTLFGAATLFEYLGI